LNLQKSLYNADEEDKKGKTENSELGMLQKRAASLNFLDSQLSPHPSASPDATALNRCVF
jgi:hypothetical protein